jgi:hypothetical protein
MPTIVQKKRPTLTLPKKDDQEDAKEIIDYFLTGRKDWNTYYSRNNLNYHLDRQFLFDSQFSNDELEQYVQDGRPILQVNLLHKVIVQLEGEFSSNVFSAKVSASGTNIQQPQLQRAIDIRKALLQHVEQMSTDKSRKSIFSNIISGGYAVMRMSVERDIDRKFQKNIVHRPLVDPTMAFFDPAARKPEMLKQDGMYCGLQTAIGVGELENLYPEIDVNDITSILPDGNKFSWSTEKERWLVDAWRKKYIPNRYIARLVSDEIISISSKEYRELKKQSNTMEINDRTIITKPMTVKRGRQKLPVLEFGLDKDAYEIHYYRLSCNRVLEHTIWPSKFFGLFYFGGQTRYINHRERTISLPHYAKDSQRFHNFIVNEIALRLKLTRYEPWMATPAMIKGFEKIYRNNAQPMNYIPYNPDPAAMGSNGMPIRQSPQEIPQSLFAQQTVTEQQIQAVTGRFDANFGAPSNESSGIAILNRASRGNSTSQIYFDSFRDSYEMLLRATLDLAKSIFDNTRTLKFTVNGNEQNVTINNVFDPATDLTEGDFDVRVEAGSSFEIQKQQNLAFLTMLTQQYPTIIPYTIDLLLENVAIPNAPQLVERVRQSPLISPQVILNESTNPKERQSAMQTIAQQQQQAQTQMQMLQQQLQLAQQKVANDSTRAHADQMRAVAQSTSDLQNAQTNRLEAMLKGATESDKIQAEQARTEAELQKAALQEAKAQARNFI